MQTRHPENLFRRRAIDSLATKFDGRPIAIMPRPWLWLAGFCTAFTFVAGWFLWSVEYARKETVRGWLVSEPGIVRLAHNNYATVAGLDRGPGDRVRQGDVILELTSDVSLGNGVKSAQQSLSHLREQLASVSTREGLSREQFRADHASLGQQLGGLRIEIDALGRQQQEQQARVERSIERFQGSRSAFERGAIAKVDVLREQDALGAMQQAVLRLGQERHALDRERQRLFASQERLGIELERALALLEAERFELQQRIARHEAQSLLSVQSPVDGTLATLDVVAGSTVRPQQLLATIVPEASSLVADVYIPSRAIGLVRSGQAVRLLYDAFPHQQFGAASGEVDAIAGFVSLPGDMPAAARLREAAYKVRVNVRSGHVQDGQARYALRPGMALAAEIVLERRTLAEWLLSPLKARL